MFIFELANRIWRQNIGWTAIADIQREREKERLGHFNMLDIMPESHHAEKEREGEREECIFVFSGFRWKWNESNPTHYKSYSNGNELRFQMEINSSNVVCAHCPRLARHR